MRSLLAVFAVVGTSVGLAVGIVEHQRTAVAAAGWTFYVPVQRNYADYLPARHPGWWPGLAGYLGLGLATGLVLASLLIVCGYRLSRVRGPGVGQSAKL